MTGKYLFDPISRNIVQLLGNSNLNLTDLGSILLFRCSIVTNLHIAPQGDKHDRSMTDGK